MRYVTDGIDTFADSRFEFRWIFARVKCVKFRACIYVYTVESSRRCSGIFNFFSRILFREFLLFFIYNLKSLFIISLKIIFLNSNFIYNLSSFYRIMI